MEVSLGSFITCFLTVLFLTVYVFVTIYVKKDVLYDGMKIVFLLISIILVRMLVPFNCRPSTGFCSVSSAVRGLNWRRCSLGYGSSSPWRKYCG